MPNPSDNLTPDTPSRRPRGGARTRRAKRHAATAVMSAESESPQMPTISKTWRCDDSTGVDNVETFDDLVKHHAQNYSEALQIAVTLFERGTAETNNADMSASYAVHDKEALALQILTAGERGNWNWYDPGTAGVNRDSLRGQLDRHDPRPVAGPLAQADEYDSICAALETLDGDGLLLIQREYPDAMGDVLDIGRFKNTEPEDVAALCDDLNCLNRHRLVARALAIMKAANTLHVTPAHGAAADNFLSATGKNTLNAALDLLVCSSYGGDALAARAATHLRNFFEEVDGAEVISTPALASLEEAIDDLQASGIGELVEKVAS